MRASSDRKPDAASGKVANGFIALGDRWPINDHALTVPDHFYRFRPYGKAFFMDGERLTPRGTFSVGSPKKADSGTTACRAAVQNANGHGGEPVGCRRTAAIAATMRPSGEDDFRCSRIRHHWTFYAN